MPKLSEKIQQDLKQAMLSKNVEATSVLRMLIAAWRNKEITLRQNGKAAFAPSLGRGELSEEQVIEVVASEIRKRHDSVEAYVRGGRQELADKETGEIKILQNYLPAQLNDEAVEKIVKEIIASGASDLPTGEAGFGKVMGQVMVKVKGRADGSRVGEIVKKLLVR